VLDLLENNKIKYWLMCGTLLGAIRDKNFLPCDKKDTDIAVLAEDYWKVRSILDKEHLKKNFLQYNFIWRREISVSDLENKYKVDIFFMEKDGENFYLYSYRPNPENKRWDWEWRLIFPYELFFPLKSIQFLGRKVFVPNNYRKVLEIHYGKSWRIPDPDWVSTEPPNKDESYKGFYPAGISPKELNIENEEYDFAYICVNILRKEATKKCVESLRQHYPRCKIYVGDQDPPTAEMYRFYEENNVEYYFLPFDCGLGYARNFLIRKVKEPYVMWGDNDFVFDEKANIYKGIELLKSKKDIGVVGGCVLVDGKEQHYERILMYDRGYGILVYIPLELIDPKPCDFKGDSYYYCDLTFNFAIARKEIFGNKKVRWNEDIKVSYEHSDFFLKLKLYSKYRVVYFPAMKVNHEKEKYLTVAGYRELRSRKADAIKFANFWNLRMNFTIGQGKEVYPTKEDLQKEKSKKPDIPSIESGVNVNLIRALEKLLDSGIPFVIVKESCLDTVRFRKLRLKPNILHVAVRREEDLERVKELIKERNFRMDVSIEKFERTKKATLYDFTVDIPFPVIQYLTEKFGDWERYGL